MVRLIVFCLVVLACPAVVFSQGMQYYYNMPLPHLIPGTTPPNDSPVPPIAEITGSVDHTGQRTAGGLDQFGPKSFTGTITVADEGSLTAGYCILEVVQPTTFVIDPDGEEGPGDPEMQEFICAGPGAYGALGDFGFNSGYHLFGNPQEFPETHSGYISANGVYTIRVNLWYVFQHSNGTWYKVLLDWENGTWTSELPPGGGEGGGKGK